MKKILLLLLFVITGTTLVAQSLRINAYSEPQLAWFSSDEAELEPDGVVFNFNTGLEADFFFQENYAFSLGLSLNNSGGRMQYGEETVFTDGTDSLVVPPEQTLKMKLQYLALPVGLKLKTEELGYATFYFQLGLNPMYNLRSRGSSEALGVKKENIKSDIVPFYLGYYATAGVEYRLAGNTALVGGLKWSSGFTDITENDAANINVNALGLHLGILF